ncbi:hypothetical protein GGF31_006400 [Allomyces arbusculus]|nr:hypothetical protein GGF31_006400 [Allomyces arbusculus]
MKQYQREYLDFCLAAGVLQFGQFTLKSGRISPYFFNAGLFNTGDLLHAVGKYYAAAMLDHQQETFKATVLFGPAYKGIPLVSATAIALACHYGTSLPYVFNRKEAKDHGEGGNLVGFTKLSGERVLIVDDVITAGTAIRESFPLLKANKAEVAGVLVAVDRMERGTGAKSAIQEVQEDMGVPVRAIVSMTDIMTYLEEKGGHETVLADMRKYRATYGI